MQRPVRSWLIRTIALVAIAAGSLVACGPEGSRTRDGGLGGSSRGAAPPTRTSEPSLAVPATMDIPYGTPGPLPTLRPGAPGAPGTPGTPPGNPVATASMTPQAPGAASPTATR
jgi:hypothetical protein